MYSQVTPSNSYVFLLELLRRIFDHIRGWPDKLADLHQDIGGQSGWVQATILFTDIVGFSATLARLPPHRQQQVLESLTCEYYDLLSKCVCNCRGSVDKFIGDGMMAVFYNLEDAVNAARQIQERVIKFNSRQEQRRHCPFPTRTAIASGWVIRKNLGTFWRRDQTYLGNAVNTASHLAKIGQPGQVLISYTTLKQLSPKAAFSRWKPIEGIGKEGEIVAYKL